MSFILAAVCRDAGILLGRETFSLRAGYSLIAVGSPPLVSSQYISSLFVLNVDVVGRFGWEAPPESGESQDE